VIREPAQTYSNSGDTNTSNPRKTIVIEGFDFNNWGINGDDCGIKTRKTLRRDHGTNGTFTPPSPSGNFKLGKLPFYQSASGVAGAAGKPADRERNVLTGGDGAGSVPGNDHNFYISGRYLIMRVCARYRTRSA
jgi:hypothetical protein